MKLQAVTRAVNPQNADFQDAYACVEGEKR